VIRAARILAGLAGVAFVVLLPGTASAQGNEPSVGSRIAVKPREMEAKRSGEIRKDYGQCMYNGYRVRSDAFLLHSDPMAVDLASAGLTDRNIKREFAMETCLGRTLGHVALETRMFFTYVQLRALLAEEAYLARYDRAAVLPADAVEAVQRTFVTTGPELVNARANAAFADCVVFNDPARSDAVLRTMPGTTEERTAARALAPTLGACLQQGQQIELKTDNIRTLVADGLWTRFVRPAETSTVASTGGSR
jgi:hypothetical protein